MALQKFTWLDWNQGKTVWKSVGSNGIKTGEVCRVK